MRHNFPILEQQNNINQTCNYLGGRQLALTNKLQHTSKGPYACGWRWGGWLADFLNPLGHTYELWSCNLHMQFCNNTCL